MRDIKILLQIVLNTMVGATDGECFEIGNAISGFGFCEITYELKEIGIITGEEEEFIDDYLLKMITSDFSKDYPVTYFDCEFGTQSSYYYFKAKDWSIRRKWLQDIINTL